MIYLLSKYGKLVRECIATILGNFGRMVKQCPGASPTPVQSPVDDISLCSSPKKGHLSCFGQTQSFFSPKYIYKLCELSSFVFLGFIYLFIYFCILMFLIGEFIGCPIQLQCNLPLYSLRF